MTRVLHVCTVPTDKSGIPNVIFNLISNFPDDSIKFGYVSINEPSNSYKEKLKDLNADLYIIERSISNSYKYIRELSKIAKHYDIIHIHGNSATMVLEMIAAKMGGMKFRIAHSHNTTCSMRIIDLIARPIFHKLCNGRLACGNEAGKWLFKDRHFSVINNGININKFKFNTTLRESTRKRLKITDEFVIGHIGNFVEQKNHSFIIEIFKCVTKINPKVKLLLLGDGPLINPIQTRITDTALTDKVIFTGSVENPEDYMSAMDLVVMPSKFEGLPLTLIEEQANGLPILASDAITKDTNITSLVTFKSLSDSPESWADKINEIFSQSTRSLEISTAAIESIKQHEYDIKVVANKLKAYYEQASR